MVDIVSGIASVKPILDVIDRLKGYATGYVSAAKHRRVEYADFLLSIADLIDKLITKLDADPHADVTDLASQLETTAAHGPAVFKDLVPETEIAGVMNTLASCARQWRQPHAAPPELHNFRVVVGQMRGIAQILKLPSPSFGQVESAANAVVTARNDAAREKRQIFWRVFWNTLLSRSLLLFTLLLIILSGAFYWGIGKSTLTPVQPRAFDEVLSPNRR